MHAVGYSDLIAGFSGAAFCSESTTLDHPPKGDTPSLPEGRVTPLAAWLGTQVSPPLPRDFTSSWLTGSDFQDTASQRAARSWSPPGPGLNSRERFCNMQGVAARNPLPVNFNYTRMCYSMLRNNASGPEIGLPGRILTGLLAGKTQNRPSDRRPDGGPISVLSR